MEMTNTQTENVENKNMKTVNMKVNPLPSKTWHWLGMNESELDIAIPENFITFTPGGEMDALRWINGVELGAYRAMGRGGGAFAWDGWNSMETGMGPEFDSAISNARTAFLDIPHGYIAAGPAIITMTAPNGKGTGKLLINAGAASEASVVIFIKDDKDEPGTLALQLLMHAEKNSHLKLYLVQSLSVQALSCTDIGGVCEERANAELIHLSLGAGRAYTGIAMKLQGDKSSFSGDMGYRVKPSQNVDINYVATHIGRETQSRMNAWGVLEKGSRKLFRGTIDFIKGCSGSKGAEKEDVLLLGEQQINQTIPLILCHEEDVEGDHGATISRLDEGVLFYLGTRGIDEKSAEEMIARARLEALISRVPDENARRAAKDLIS